VTGADNQQGRRHVCAEPSETIRQAPTHVGKEIVRAAWRHAEAGGNDRPARSGASDPGQSALVAQCTSNRSERNSLSGKTYLPRRSARSGRVPAHIGEALPALPAAGNPEGSPSDPVTTDPKGEAGRGPRTAADVVMTRNTPALIKTRDAYGAGVPLDPWYVSGLTQAKGASASRSLCVGSYGQGSRFVLRSRCR
jgi:hypothetical protein